MSDKKKDFRCYAEDNRIMNVCGAQCLDCTEYYAKEGKDELKPDKA